MATPTVIVNTQRNPVGYLARRFVSQYNLTAQIKGLPTVPGAGTPTMNTHSANAYATFALLRLRTAMLAQTDDGAGNWDAEAVLAAAMADRALAEVSATHTGYFPTAQRVFAKLTDYATNYTGGNIPAPSALPADWITNRGARIVAGALAIAQSHGTGLNIDLLDGATNPETTEVITVAKVDGKNWQIGRTFAKGGVQFVMAANFRLTAIPIGASKPPIVMNVELSDGVSENIVRVLTVTLTNAAPTAANIVTTVANNTAIAKNFLALSNAADADGDTLRITEIDGVAIPTPFAAGNYNFVSAGKAFVLAKATGIVTAAAQPGVATWFGTFKVGDSESNSVARNWSIENLA